MTNHNDNAYPMVIGETVEFGLTKREYFAAIALQGLVAMGNTVPTLTAKRAVDMADALIEALNQNGDPVCREPFPGSVMPDAE